MSCDDCGAPVPAKGLCDTCWPKRLRLVQAAALRNIGPLCLWAMDQTASPGEAILSLLLAALVIHSKEPNSAGSTPIAVWMERAQSLEAAMTAAVEDRWREVAQRKEPPQ